MDLDASTLTTPESGTDESGLIRAEGLWFEDCGLIIRAENTLFRISREYLAFQSTVFKDILSLPPPKDVETMDGYPFVFLPDSAKDVTIFLKTLMFFE